MSKISLSPRGQRLVNQVLRLHWEEQLDIAEMLQRIHECPPGMLSMDDPNFEEIIAERIRKYEAGESKAVPAEEVFARLDEKYEFKFAKINGQKYPVWMKPIRERCAELGAKLSWFYEHDYQIEFCDALLRDGYTAIREYPYSLKPDAARIGRVPKAVIALASGEDCRNIQNWIEFKPVPCDGCEYWRPSKFFDTERVFEKDIHKLAMEPTGDRYYVLFAETHERAIFDSVCPPIKHRQKYLDVQQMAWAISNWAGGARPVELEAFRTGRNEDGELYGHLLIWPVTKYVKHDILICDGCYVMTPSSNASAEKK